MDIGTLVEIHLLKSGLKILVRAMNMADPMGILPSLGNLYFLKEMKINV